MHCFVLGGSQRSLVNLAWLEVSDLTESLLKTVSLGDEVVLLDQELVHFLHQSVIVLQQSSLVFGRLDMLADLVHVMLMMLFLVLFQLFLELFHLFLFLLVRVVVGQLVMFVLVSWRLLSRVLSGLDGVSSRSLSDVLRHHWEVSV